MSASPEFLCIGAAHWDVIGRSPQAVQCGDDLPGEVEDRPGGVALNIARALVEAGHPTALLAAVGRDAAGVALVAALERDGVQTTYLHRPAHLPTDRYLAIEGAQGLIAAIADNTTLEHSGAGILAPLVRGSLRDWRGLAVLDCGMSATALAEARCLAPLQRDLRLACAAPVKVGRLRPFLGSDAVFYLNRHEACALLGQEFADSQSAAEALVAAGAKRAIVTDGARPATDADRDGALTRPAPQVTPRRITGAGDAFLAAHLAAEHSGTPRKDALDAALAQAARHISSP